LATDRLPSTPKIQTCLLYIEQLKDIVDKLVLSCWPVIVPKLYVLVETLGASGESRSQNLFPMLFAVETDKVSAGSGATDCFARSIEFVCHGGKKVLAAEATCH
jgi:hypothetical protein